MPFGGRSTLGFIIAKGFVSWFFIFSASFVSSQMDGGWVVLALLLLQVCYLAYATGSLCLEVAQFAWFMELISIHIGTTLLSVYCYSKDEMRHSPRNLHQESTLMCEAGISVSEA
jgi:formate hydrogenlyase subunit 3/multisubunit Na+/H+ antiporter MnhD subunit